MAFIFTFTPTATGDPDFASVEFLLNFNDDTTTATVGGAATATIGTVTFEAGQANFGDVGIFSGDMITYPSTTIAFGTGDFTVEFWVNMQDISRDFPIFLTATAIGGFGFLYRRPAGSGRMGVTTNGGAEGITHVINPNLNQWYHMAYSRESGTGYLFLDGTQVATGADTVNYVTSGGMSVSGVASNFASLTRCDAKYDDIRITTGVARYNASFSIPTESYPTS